MDLRKLFDKYLGIPLFCFLIYYFYLKKKHTKFEFYLYIFVIIALCIDIILSFELIKTRYVSWNYLFLTG